jgi:hypothetical protein
VATQPLKRGDLVMVSEPLAVVWGEPWSPEQPDSEQLFTYMTELKRYTPRDLSMLRALFNGTEESLGVPDDALAGASASAGGPTRSRCACGGRGAAAVRERQRPAAAHGAALTAPAAAAACPPAAAPGEGVAFADAGYEELLLWRLIAFNCFGDSTPDLPLTLVRRCSGLCRGPPAPALQARTRTAALQAARRGGSRRPAASCAARRAAPTREAPPAPQARGEEPRPQLGVWPEFSLLNHSCIPNSVNYLMGDRMVVRAVRPVAAGEEVQVEGGFTS